MDIKEFIINFLDQFDEEQVGEVNEGTSFRELAGWSSLVALSVMAMVDEEYDVQLTADEIRNAETLGDLFRIVKSRKLICDG